MEHDYDTYTALALSNLEAKIQLKNISLELHSNKLPQYNIKIPLLPLLITNYTEYSNIITVKQIFWTKLNKKTLNTINKLFNCGGASYWITDNSVLGLCLEIDYYINENDWHHSKYKLTCN